MAIRCLADLRQAAQAGRVASPRFLKNASAAAGDGSWFDWSFASGQPAYDARIGEALSFNPSIAVGNDAIYIPPIAAGMERRLMGMTVRSKASNSNQVVLNYEVYDLLGVYPLIDGDSTDQQDMDNTLTLPRYSTGDGVVAVLVNHVAPMTAAANGSYTYTGCDGTSRTVAFRAALVGANRVASAMPTAGGAGPIGLPQGNGCGGVRQIDSITFSTAPGGLFAIYLIRPLMSLQHYTDPINVAATNGIKEIVQKCNCMHGAWDLPIVYDGAHIGFFYMANAGGRTNDFFGHFHFAWG
jgi:hypothetical protein